MGYNERVLLYNKLIDQVDAVSATIDNLMLDLKESKESTDSNFYNKLQDLEDKIIAAQDIVDALEELNLNIYNFKP